MVQIKSQIDANAKVRFFCGVSRNAIMLRASSSK